MRKKILFIVLLGLIGSVLHSARAISFDMDSIAQWGRFAKFCVDTYRWGDRTFSSYNPDYVVGTGYKFTVSPVMEGWGDAYHIIIPEGYRMDMNTDPFVSVGAKIQYMAVSYTYSRTLRDAGTKGARSKFSWGFSCNMFELNLSHVVNNMGTTITNIKDEEGPMKVDVPFRGLNSKTLTVDGVYYFNHKKYSQAGTFGMGRIQKRSQGSFFAGLQYEYHRINLDFSSIISPGVLPEEDLTHGIFFHNYFLTGGYGYNWAIGKGWIVGIWDGVSTGLTHGYSTGYTKHDRIGVTNKIRFGLGWNSHKWFANAMASNQICWYHEDDYSLYQSLFTFTISAGYRFNLW